VVFGPLVPLLRCRDKGAIRLALTLLQVSRLISGWKAVDLSSVVNVSSMTESTLVEFRKELPKIMAS